MNNRDNIEFAPFCLTEGTDDRTVVANFMEALTKHEECEVIDVIIRGLFPDEDARIPIQLFHYVTQMLRDDSEIKFDSITMRVSFRAKYTCLIFVEGTVSIYSPAMSKEDIELMIEEICEQSLELD